MILIKKKGDVPLVGTPLSSYKCVSVSRYSMLNTPDSAGTRLLC